MATSGIYRKSDDSESRSDSQLQILKLILKLIALHPCNTVFSPTVVVTLGALALSASIIEFVLEIFSPSGSVARDVS